MDVKKIFGRPFVRAGKYALICAVLAVAVHHWGVVQLDNVPLPHFVDFLYVYIVVNASAATPFIYWERKSRVTPEKLCPQCGKALESYPCYKCPDCGKIKFKRE